MASLEDKKRLAEAKIQSMIRLFPKKTEAEPKKAEDKKDDEKFETVYKSKENPLIKPSSFGLRPLYSKVDINCDKWLLTLNEKAREKLNNPPSLADGLDPVVESELRYLGCELIQEGAILLELPQTAAATAQILYQRFYYQRSFIKYFFEHTVMACLLLASKIEEEPRYARDVYNVFTRLEKLHKFKRSGIKITSETTKKLRATPLDAAYVRAKNNIILAERRILATLGFVVHVKHPHRLIVAYCHILNLSNSREDILQKAWNYMNDGLRTDMFLRYTPETIACACIHLAARTVDNPVPLPSTPFHWFEAFDTSDRDVEAISIQLIRLYTRKSTPNWPRLTAEIDKIRDAIEAKKKAEKAKEVALKMAAAEKRREEEMAEQEQKRREKENDRRGNDYDASPDNNKNRKRERVRSRSRDRANGSWKRNGDKDRERERERDRDRERSRKDRRRDDKRDRHEKERKRRSRSRDRDMKQKERSKAREKEVKEVMLGKKYKRESVSPPPKRR